MNEFADAPILATNYLTIEGFEKLTTQEIFDMAAKQVLTNGAGYDAKKGACRYNLGCAASVFLREGCKVKADEEGGSWNILVQTKLVPEHEHAFIRAMQRIHDDAAMAATEGVEGNLKYYPEAFLTRWQYDMRNLAAAHGVSSIVFDNAA